VACCLALSCCGAMSLLGRYCMCRAALMSLGFGSARLSCF
jgi:hypothetical protein